MNLSKKAIGFFFLLGFFILCFFLTKMDAIKSFSDFSLFEWQTLLVTQGKLNLPYLHSALDPEYQFFPLPNLFFHLTNDHAHSTFPNSYPILASPFYFFFGINGIQSAQFLLFLISIWIFFVTTKNEVLTLFLFFGSSIVLYIFLVHDTILVFFLEILVIFLYQKEKPFLTAFFTVFVIWMRPEMVFVFCYLPFLIPNSIPWRKYFFYCSIFFLCFALIHFVFYHSFLPLRLIKNSQTKWNPEVGVYLLRLVWEQIPIFLLLVLYMIWEWFHQTKNYLQLFLVCTTILVCFLSPNTGGHDTPRYFYGFIPLYLLSMENKNKKLTIHPMILTLLLVLVSIYFTYGFHSQFKTLSKISKYQSNTLSAITSLKEKTIVVNNSDLAFIVLPLLTQNKDILLLREEISNSGFANFLTKNQIPEFVFVEIPPSPYPIPDSLVSKDCQNHCIYQKRESTHLPNALLPISISRYLRSF